MRLRDLDATFVGSVNFAEKTWRKQTGIEAAQGVSFQCPRCAARCLAEGKGVVDGNHGGKAVAGAHSVLCWFREPRGAPPVPDTLDPKPGRWFFTGDSLDTLTFVGPGLYSVQLNGGCHWHGYVRDGEAVEG